MTQIAWVTKKCGLCNTAAKYQELVSTNSFGSSDLDKRPPQMKRSTIGLWIQKCPQCGFCAPDLSGPISDIAEIVQGEAYRVQLNCPDYPTSANQHLCWALIEEKTGSLGKAGYACVYAAWICDDAKNEKGAGECRKRGVDFFLKARAKGESFDDTVGGEEALLADLLRRSGHADLAREVCEQGLKKNPGKVLVAVFEFQKGLIAKGDTACHTVEESQT